MQRIAGLFYFLAGSTIIFGILLAEIFYPASAHYSLSFNMISDLAFTRTTTHIIPEPSAFIFNSSLILSGLFVLLASVFIRKTQKKMLVYSSAFLGVSAMGIGIFPEYYKTIHPIIAVLAFSSGGITALLFGKNIKNITISFISYVLGSVSLLFLVIGVLLPSLIVPTLGRGGVERIVAYPLFIWLIVAGIYYLSIPEFKKR
ncbi:MAG: DUF998 domain-containing protein [Candidatus Levybacteria bacterium]|nr:DUF998 domain-containing protein [Candidatus Levybacteria bacterium]